MVDVTDLVSIVFSGLSVLVIEDVGEVICVRARTRDAAVACPNCGAPTVCVHGCHERTVADVPVDGRRVLVRALVAVHWASRNPDRTLGAVLVDGAYPYDWLDEARPAVSEVADYTLIPDAC
jgi:hypothetical protein